MRYLFGFLCVCALAVVSLVGCGETGAFACTEQGILDAIAEGGGPHTFDCNGPTTVVTKSEIVIDNDVILDGEGNLTLDGNGEHRVIYIPHDSYHPPSVELRGLTLTGGQSYSGSAIHSTGKLMLENCVVSGNTSDHPSAGAVTNELGWLTIAKSSVSNNVANGVTTDSLAETVIDDSEIEGNTGAGVLNLSGIVSIENSTVSRNGARGVYNGFQMVIRNSTVSQNSGDVGGGIWNAGYSPPSDFAVQTKSPYGAEILIVNSTISGNSAAQGGALFNSGDWGEAELVHSTIAENSTTDGADIEGDTGSHVSFTSTIIAGNCVFRGSSASTPSDNNIESPGHTCGFDQATDQVDVTAADLNLGPLADNGGPTETHKPGDGEFGDGSAAIDQIPEADCGVDTDQRGEPRPETGGTMCDVGSVEAQPPCSSASGGCL
jgi:hypothetical protein